MGMAQGPGEELAPRGRTVYSDAELVKAEGRLLTALSAQQPHGRPPGVSPLPRDPHPTTLRPLPPPPPPPPPRRPPAHSTHSPIMQRGNRCRRHVTSGRRWLGAVVQNAGRHFGCGQAALSFYFFASHRAVGG